MSAAALAISLFVLGWTVFEKISESLRRRQRLRAGMVAMVAAEKRMKRLYRRKSTNAKCRPQKRVKRAKCNER